MFSIMSRRVAYKTHDSMSKVKVTLRGQRSKLGHLYLVRAVTSQVIVVSPWYLVEMFSIMSRRVAYKTHDSMSKVKVTLRGQRSKLGHLYLVRAVTSQVIVVSPWYLVEMFSIMSRRVAYKTHDSMSKVKVTLRGQRSKLGHLYLVRAVTSQVIVVSPWYLVEMFSIMSRRVAYKTHDSMSKVKVTLRGQRSKLGHLYLVRAVTSQVIVVSPWYFVEMFTLICRGVTYKTHDYMSKVKVTLRGQRSKLCNLYLVRPTTSRVIVVSSWYLVEMFTLICRHVTYKTHDSMSKGHT